MKKTIGILILIYMVFMVIQLINHSNQKASLNLNLANIINDYNVLGIEAFKQKIVEIYRSDRLKVKPEDIIITENNSQGTFRVEIHYRRIFYLFFFPIERKLVVSRESSKLKI